ncbi:unnamed protein product [Bursaphelenchus okinawaensis]|uniref:Peptidase A1 domain-containing protein n=1 Tax=Bursaphelenchus okinawaensis TaxID=465554 RepID=A0A811LNW7_9BILA|nr:unnamed protein product [Bursaphelenchus okinawaensis]CAG9125137.1 unnamed protein product [Bursaphelenchus okinawaensis]
MLTKLLCITLCFQILACDAFQISIKKNLHKSKSGLIGGRLENLDNNFVGVISVGSPLQDITVALDFNSSLLWVPSEECKCNEECSIPEICDQECSAHCCEAAQNDERPVDPELTGTCTHKGVFNTKKSNTLITAGKSQTFQYKEDSLTADLIYDQLSLGPKHKPAFTARNVKFGVVKDVPESYEQTQYDGVFGLAINNENKEKSVVKQLASRNLISQPIVNVWINGNQTKAVVDGLLSFGYVDSRVCNTTYQPVPLTSAENWEFNIESGTFGQLRANRSKAVINLNQHDLTVPQVLFNAIVYYYDIRTDPLTKAYVGSCPTSQNLINLNINNFNYFQDVGALTSSVGNKQCQFHLKVAEKDATQQFVLGSSFFQRYCIVLDYTGKIGFPNAVKGVFA